MKNEHIYHAAFQRCINQLYIEIYLIHQYNYID